MLHLLTVAAFVVSVVHSVALPTEPARELARSSATQYATDPTTTEVFDNNHVRSMDGDFPTCAQWCYNDLKMNQFQHKTGTCSFTDNYEECLCKSNGLANPFVDCIQSKCSTADMVPALDQYADECDEHDWTNMVSLSSRDTITYESRDLGNRIPACGQQCYAESLHNYTNSQCPYSHQECLCRSPIFANPFAQCVQTSCSPSNTSITQQTYIDVCQEYFQHVPQPPPASQAIETRQRRGIVSEYSACALGCYMTIKSQQGDSYGEDGFEAHLCRKPALGMDFDQCVVETCGPPVAETTKEVYNRRCKQWTSVPVVRKDLEDTIKSIHSVIATAASTVHTILDDDDKHVTSMESEVSARAHVTDNNFGRSRSHVSMTCSTERSLAARAHGSLTSAAILGAGARSSMTRMAAFSAATNTAEDIEKRQAVTDLITPPGAKPSAAVDNYPDEFGIAVIPATQVTEAVFPSVVKRHGAVVVSQISDGQAQVPVSGMPIPPGPSTHVIVTATVPMTMTTTVARKVVTTTSKRTNRSSSAVTPVRTITTRSTTEPRATTTWTQTVTYVGMKTTTATSTHTYLRTRTQRLPQRQATALPAQKALAAEQETFYSTQAFTTIGGPQGESKPRHSVLIICNSLKCEGPREMEGTEGYKFVEDNSSEERLNEERAPYVRAGLHEWMMRSEPCGDNAKIFSEEASSPKLEAPVPAGYDNTHPRTCHSYGALNLTLSSGVLTDSVGRQGYIAGNGQLQFDSPPQAGALYTAGFSEVDGVLGLGPNTIFWRCGSGGFYNLYDRNWASQCEPVFLRIVDYVDCEVIQEQDMAV